VTVSSPLYQMLYGRQLMQPETSLGSGVFVSEDGYVLTNSHVVQDRNAEIKVTMPDNRELSAKVVGIDPHTDLAVLKTTRDGVTPHPVGDSSKLRVAEWVLAVGNPFEFNQTVTLSASSRRPTGTTRSWRRITISSRPTRPSIPATRAARSSRAAASSWASTR
jgi:S1-C subfamily serine protease